MLSSQVKTLIGISVILHANFFTHSITAWLFILSLHVSFCLACSKTIERSSLSFFSSYSSIQDLSASPIEDLWVSPIEDLSVAGSIIESLHRLIDDEAKAQGGEGIKRR
ncbi:hypothetical protein L1987_35289 [Smallanthus sonchifolius]|uniref:Uncharacterized protein n=1 Tax=Smallanthus sonchifolius TaxID=185202 RepID=A0ACB9HXD7_9ASTR|nr:hypothetical protein L1987_35289 [Smallanthus sonchifolius]